MATNVAEIEITTPARLREGGDHGAQFQVECIDAAGNSEFRSFDSEADLAAFLVDLHQSPFSSAVHIDLRRGRNEDGRALLARLQCIGEALATFRDAIVARFASDATQ